MLKHLPEFESRVANIAATQLKEFFAQEPPRRNMPVLLKKLIPVNPLVFVGLILLVVGIAIFIILNIVTKSTDSMFAIVLMTAIGLVLLIWGLLRFRKWRSILCQRQDRHSQNHRNQNPADAVQRADFLSCPFTHRNRRRQHG